MAPLTTTTETRLDDLDLSKTILGDDVAAVREDNGLYTLYSYNRSGSLLTELARNVSAAEALHTLDEIDVLDVAAAEALAA